MREGGGKERDQSRIRREAAQRSEQWHRPPSAGVRGSESRSPVVTDFHDVRRPHQKPRGRTGVRVRAGSD